MRRPRVRFTLRGMMVIVAVVLAPLLLPLRRAVDRAREGPRRAQCVCNLKWAALALHHFASANGSLPFAARPDAELPPHQRAGWIVACWPYLDSFTRLDSDPTRAWDRPPNWPPRIVSNGVSRFHGSTPEDTACGWMTCPDDPTWGRNASPRRLTYVGIAGLGPDAPTLPAGHPRAGVFGYARTTRFADISDGTGQTLMLAETSSGFGPWTAGGPSIVRGVDPATRPYLGPGRPFGGYHPGGANVAMADGSVRFVRETIHPGVFGALATISGGEVLPAGWGDR